MVTRPTVTQAAVSNDRTANLFLMAAAAPAAWLAVASGAANITAAAAAAQAARERGLVRACMACSFPGRGPVPSPSASMAAGVAVLLRPVRVVGWRSQAWPGW